ncbi:MAG: hypothetical protein JXQ90_06925 [Cyclobacteriaceae bacterium]
MTNSSVSSLLSNVGLNQLQVKDVINYIQHLKNVERVAPDNAKRQAMNEIRKALQEEYSF